VQGTAFFVAALIAYSLNVGSYLILKNSIKRDRPHNQLNDFRALIEPSDRFSFPSGHTSAAFLMATLMLHFYPSFAGAIFIWATLIGLSRILLGVHYPGDILAGSLLGYGCAELGIIIGDWSL
jgi:undecaprenyl-diphosphatase